MTITNSAVEGIQRAVALLDSTAKKVADESGTSDIVDLSETALALIQARIAVAANVSALRTAVEIQRTLLKMIA
jgi:hypothetical protein